MPRTCDRCKTETATVAAHQDTGMVFATCAACAPLLTRTERVETLCAAGIAHLWVRSMAGSPCCARCPASAASWSATALYTLTPAA